MTCTWRSGDTSGSRTATTPPSTRSPRISSSAAATGNSPCRRQSPRPAMLMRGGIRHCRRAMCGITVVSDLTPGGCRRIGGEQTSRSNLQGRSTQVRAWSANQTWGCRRNLGSSLVHLVWEDSFVRNHRLTDRDLRGHRAEAPNTLPTYRAFSPISSSICNSRLYFAVRSPRTGAPVLI